MINELTFVNKDQNYHNHQQQKSYTDDQHDDCLRKNKRSQETDSHAIITQHCPFVFCEIVNVHSHQNSYSHVDVEYFLVSDLEEKESVQKVVCLI